MKHKFYIIIPLLAAATLLSSYTFDKIEWGFYGHKRINRMAVFTLPQEMIGFYKKNIEYITDHAVDPDKRRYATKHEAVRHYIDIDHWGTDPFNAVPKHLGDAVMKYCDFILYTEDGDTIQFLGNELAHSNMKLVDASKDLYLDKYGKEVEFTYTEYSYPRGKFMIVKENAQKIFGQDSMVVAFKDLSDFYRKNVSKLYYEDEWMIDAEPVNELLEKYNANIRVKSAQVIDHFSEYGICPYNLVSMHEKLTRAFESGDESRIMRISAEMGHYIGDAHVPLHTTENYNGQLTNQDGIHGFWESRLPELFADETYNFFVGKAEYIDNPREYYWNVVQTSHQYVDSILHIEKELSETFPQDKQYCYEQRLEATVKTQCKDYATAFHKRLDGMVERRMTASVKSIGSVWFSCWVDAGQPKLKKFDKFVLSEEERKKLEEEEKMFRAGNIKGREH